MSYRVFVPCAGTGSRLGVKTRYLNKSLVSVANRPVLSHIIEGFPDDAEFVVALGYKGHLVREFLTLAYPQRTFFFEQVSVYEGPNSGLGLTLQSCKAHLSQPFVFISCDTLVEEVIPPPDTNWMGYAEVNHLESYRTIAIKSEKVISIAEKGEGEPTTNKAYIGLAGIYDFGPFWDAMDHGQGIARDAGEVFGLRSLIEKVIHAKLFNWHDTGTPDSLALARQRYRDLDEPNILEKQNESLWFIDNSVIKFSDDAGFIANRVSRAEQLCDFVPIVNAATTHMYRYTKAEGKVFSESVTVPLFNRLLEHCEYFWERRALPTNEAIGFRRTCMRFYRDKTLERVELFYKTFDRRDGSEEINGKPMPPLNKLLDSVNWDWLADGLPGRFHGDLHFENILWNTTAQRFIFLDWRQDFGGDLCVGDIYYDLSKILHGLVVCHQIVAANLFTVKWNSKNIDYDFNRKQVLVECESEYLDWLASRGYDSKKVRVLTALIYLNIASLHHDPYSLLLYSLGKSMLKAELES